MAAALAVFAESRASPKYRPRRPEDSVLHRILREHLNSFLSEARDNHARGLPKYVEQEFRAYLECGIPAYGFALAHCRDCGLDIVVAFSCKKRGACPSCNARRMSNTAANLADRVFPDERVRQWVLTVPFELRLLLASRADALTLVSRVFVDEIFRWQRARAASTGALKSRGGAVAFHHRFGGSLNLHVHFHVCVLDGVYTESDDGGPGRFLPAPAPDAMDLQEITQTVHVRVVRWLRKRGLLADFDDDGSPVEPSEPSALDACLQGSLGVGKLVELKEPGVLSTGEAQQSDEGPAPRIRERGRHARDGNGYSIHAGVVVEVGDAAGRERLFRYCGRGPFALDRLSVSREGLVVYKVRNPWKRSQTHRVMTPLEIMARMSALIPPPRHPLVRFHGVLAPHSAWRKQIVPASVSASAASEPSCESVGTCGAEPVAESTGQLGVEHRAEAAASPSGPVALVNSPDTAAGGGPGAPWRIDWATLLKRVYDIDALACPCGGRLRFTNVVTDRTPIAEILKRLGLSSEPPQLAAAGAFELDYDCPAPDW